MKTDPPKRKHSKGNKPSFGPPKSSAGPLARPHIVVDGHNIIHAWPELAKMLGRYGIHATQARLVELVRILHDFRGMRVTIVFDGNSPTTTVDYLTRDKQLAIVHAAKGLSADCYIEQYAAYASDKQSIQVATHDRGIASVVVGFGGFALTPRDLLSLVVQAQKEQSSQLTRPHRPGAQQLATLGDVFPQQLKKRP